MASYMDNSEMHNSGSGSTQDSGQPSDSLQALLRTLGLEKYYPNKLTLRFLLEINSASVSDEEPNSLQAIPWAFLRKLLMVNSNSRSLLSTFCENDETEDSSAEEDCEGCLNLLDLSIALFACADSFLQQEITLKMSMCQFAVPFLIPQEVHGQCTLKLWALRGILKEWRPHSMTEYKGFVEENVVHANIPLVSFVRLRNCSLSKSQVLNEVLSQSQQHHDFFLHREMIGGSAQRLIANGLVEICWNLPCGNNSIDAFPEPVAIANLRGDICTFETQFSFLTQVSAAIFVFLDSVEQEEQILFASLEKTKSKIFLVVNSQREMKENVKTSVETAIGTLKLEREYIIKKSQKANLARFSKIITSAMKKLLGESSISSERSKIESMKNVAQELGVVIDEYQSKASVSAESAAEDIIKGFGILQVVDYKKRQLPLQGENWKRLAQIEKEECRLQNSGQLSLEEYKVQLLKEKDEIWNKQSKYRMTKAMTVFIRALSTSDYSERAFFLRWMGLKLDSKSRKHLSELRHKYKECERKGDREGIACLDQSLLDSALGIEHYMREMGLIYETASLGSSKLSEETSHLPVLAAELLLAGFPLELLDGEASNIPQKWISDVLMELHRKVGQKSRLLVLTVLGVQSSGKSTLLNTMFGVQFAVSSGRCTRGASMLFLPLGEDLKEELQCDFVLLIDTEGLKSPALALLEDSYEHDNELATLVIGLSDVTIINIAMENSTEMKDVLQIAVHAFLRMKEIGKKTVCHFVHQNVAGVSAYNKNMTERKQLLDHLNEMTKIAAGMEKQHKVNEFTDVLDYDVKKNNWYIPGLWHGTPPMAPVNTGYSVAVFDFKQNLVEILKARKEEQPFQIPEFLQWMSSLWKAVKFENFIFSFRNTLVAHAYDSLCKEVTEWEWCFRKHIQSWLTNATVKISNTETSCMQSINEVVDPLREEAKKEIASQTKEMTEKLKDYYKRKDRYVHLVVKYKTDFAKSIKNLENEMKDEVRKRLEAALEMRRNKQKVEEIHRQQAAMIEFQVLQLLQNYKYQKDELSDEDLKADFESMWRRELENISSFKERDIPADVFKQMRSNLMNRNVSEDLQKVQNLTQYGLQQFQVKDKHVKFLTRLRNFFTRQNAKQDVEILANDVILNCCRMIEELTKSKMDYQDVFTKDIFEEIDMHLKQAGTKVNIKFEVDLKLHICGIASRKFREMHRKFLTAQDPLKNLEKFKSQYLSDFIDLYKKRDQCQRKAQDFTQLCLKPAVTEYINQSLGTDIVDAVLANSPTEYSTRFLFQYNIQKDMLEQLDFTDFLHYILHYKSYVKDWIYNHIIQCFSEDISLQKLKMKKLDNVFEKIMKAVEASKHGEDGLPLSDDAESTRKLIQNFCTALSKIISVPRDAVEGVLFQNTSCCSSFTKSLCECLDDMKRQLAEEISRSSDIVETLNSVLVKPQDELFKRVFGCGKQCPFCKVPCDAGTKKHQNHHAAVHRPQGLGTYRDLETNILCEEICTSSVHGNGAFLNHETNFEPHPYKQYHTYYPNWTIPPDSSIEASDYWKFVLVTFNNEFAERYKAKPAVYPEAWNRLTKDQALISLKSAFNIT
ncbi:up-regulator of cell proliferation-like [Colossoma macropomum]|uniref:up-regulator of cell proliferation-like n=1 Tax=Colossoma macropomum TaxID=42526 RepID=UPI00186493AD|nr:up-regulator of cell proliferation-like [Colossoma macropomum]